MITKRNQQDPIIFKIRHHPGPDAPDDDVKIIFTNAGILCAAGFPDIKKINEWHEKNNPQIFGDNRTDKQKFEDDLVLVFQRTEIEDRELIAHEFETGSRSLWPRIVGRGLDPVALFVAALVDAESSLVLFRDRLIYSTLDATADFVRYYRPSFFRQPVDNSGKAVDNSAKTVDRSVENPVDIFVSYPQDPGDFLQPVDKSANLPTSSRLIHMQPVDKSDPPV